MASQHVGITSLFARLTRTANRRDIPGNPLPLATLAQFFFPNISNRLAYQHQAFIPLGFRNYLRRHVTQFDVAHLHACRNLPCEFAAHYLRRAGIPYVVQPNGTAPIIERHLIAKRLFDFVAGRRTLLNGARVLAVSSAERRQLTELGVADRSIRVIGNPITCGVHAFFDTRLVSAGVGNR